MRPPYLTAHPRPCGRSRGLTFTEILVAVLVGLLILAGLHRIFVAGLTTQTTTSLQTEVNRKAQVALDHMMDRLRGGSQVLEAYPDRVWFLDQDDYHVRYWRSGDTLQYYRGTVPGAYSGGMPLASNVAQMSLEYLDQAGQPAANADDVATVAVALQVERQQHSALLKSAARLRNK